MSNSIDPSNPTDNMKTNSNPWKVAVGKNNAQYILDPHTGDVIDVQEEKKRKRNAKKKRSKARKTATSPTGQDRVGDPRDEGAETYEPSKVSRTKAPEDYENKGKGKDGVEPQSFSDGEDGPTDGDDEEAANEIFQDAQEIQTYYCVLRIESTLKHNCFGLYGSAVQLMNDGGLELIAAPDPNHETWVDVTMHDGPAPWRREKKTRSGWFAWLSQVVPSWMKGESIPSSAAPRRTYEYED
ncbi:hypothetical protein LTS18_003810 [Coniosporium uncinatum]|uniref:Uncharacterized protein n=1 Tax=Coniosporium uncinatum TaxID=93489 RepID=A0ACC3DZU8_9PEZI|nr:hypothetical protein LTS18_003810 [Coniosporium uncinatum]